MSDHKAGMMMPALVGGAAAGLLSALPFSSCLCCLWIIGGAMLASYLLAKESPSSLTSGDGAIVGIFTGIVATVVEYIASLPFQTIERAIARRFLERFSEVVGEIPSGWEELLDRSTSSPSPAMVLFGLVVAAFIFAALGALGGILGASLFGKKKTPPGQGTPDAA